MGNARSGRRPSAETRLRDVGMTHQLAREVLRRAVSAHRDQGRALATLHELLGDGDRQIADALTAMRPGALTSIPRAA